MYSNLNSNTIYNSPKQKTVQIPINRRMDKQWWSDTVNYYAARKKGINHCYVCIINVIDESHKLNVEGQEPAGKVHTV